MDDGPLAEPVLVLLRHAARGPLPPDAPGNDVPILHEGRARAEDMGRQLGARLVSLHASPVLRCTQTAEALRIGGGLDVPIATDAHLGDPGVYVNDGEVAWQAWLDHGHAGVISALVEGVRFPGMADPHEATARLLLWMADRADGAPGLHIFVTHDLLVAVAASHLLGVELTSRDWPGFLEGCLVFPEQAVVRYRQWSRQLARPYPPG